MIDSRAAEVFPNRYGYERRVAEVKDGISGRSGMRLHRREDQWRKELIAGGFLASGHLSRGKQVMPIRLLNYSPFTTLVSEREVLMEGIDDAGRIHLYVLQQHPERRYRWRVARTLSVTPYLS